MGRCPAAFRRALSFGTSVRLKRFQLASVTVKVRDSIA